MSRGDVRNDILQYMESKTTGDENKYIVKCNKREYNVKTVACTAKNQYQAFLQFYNFLWNTYEIDLIEIATVHMGSYSCYTELIKFIIKYYFENENGEFSIIEDEEFTSFPVQQPLAEIDPKIQYQLDMQLDLQVITEIAKHSLYLDPIKKDYYTNAIITLLKFHVTH